MDPQKVAGSVDTASEEGARPARPLISVCIPMYNNAATIAQCLDSILSQKGVEFEIVVVDDDSQDESFATAAGILRSQDRLIRNETRLGLNQNHNKCLELASGTCIQIVHGDDALLPGALETLSRCFENPNVGLAFAPRDIVTEHPEWEQQYGEPHMNFRALRELNDGSSLVRQMAIRGVKENWIGEPTSVMFRRQTALDAGGFRSDIYNFVDLDFWVRLMLRSTVCFVPQEQSIRYHSFSTESARNWVSERDFLDRLRILTWMVVDPASSPGIRMLAGFWWPLAWLRLSARTAAHGPDRRTRIKTLMVAPVREFATARGFLRCLTKSDR